MNRLILFVVSFALVCIADAQAPTPSAETRVFRMGFTGFVPAYTKEGVDSTKEFCRKHADLMAHHIEGAAWTEMHSGSPLPAKLLDSWKSKRGRAPDGGKVFLALSPGRGELKVCDNCAPLAKDLKSRGYGDAEVIAAYVQWCQKAIDYFKPDWLVIGIEMNEVMKSNPAAWSGYLKLHEETRRALKKDHPALPIAASFSLHTLFKGGDAAWKEWQRLDAGNDFVAVSYYPFLSAERLRPIEWLLERADGRTKPIAFVETGDAAEVLPMPKAKVTIQGSPEKQRDYFEYLLPLAERRRFSFVVSFIHQDYDELWEMIKKDAPELFMAWRDCGLIDEKGRERPALKVWDQWLARKAQP